MRTPELNLLAHALLATQTSESIVGNVAADFIPGREVDALPDGIRSGVMQHRHIDGFTDRHPSVQQSIPCISQQWGWFSGIIIDVYFDYLLTLQWHLYSNVELQEFIDTVHESLLYHSASLPESTQRTMAWFIENKILMSYTQLSGIESALAGISRRIAKRIPQRAVDLSRAMPDLQASHDRLLQHFTSFFPQVQQYARTLNNSN